jgi:hypothetical protein
VAIDMEEWGEKANPGPRFKKRTWGTLRVGLVKRRRGGARDDGRGRVRREGKPRSQVQKPNLGHPPCWFGLEED